jgi:hypothetical protein
VLRSIFATTYALFDVKCPSGTHLKDSKRWKDDKDEKRGRSLQGGMISPRRNDDDDPHCMRGVVVAAAVGASTAVVSSYCV